jgi:hypothetical protein
MLEITRLDERSRKATHRCFRQAGAFCKLSIAEKRRTGTERAQQLESAFERSIRWSSVHFQLLIRLVRHTQ